MSNKTNWTRERIEIEEEIRPKENLILPLLSNEINSYLNEISFVEELSRSHDKDDGIDAITFEKEVYIIKQRLYEKADGSFPRLFYEIEFRLPKDQISTSLITKIDDLIRAQEGNLHINRYKCGEVA